MMIPVTGKMRNSERGRQEDARNGHSAVEKLTADMKRK